MLNSVAIEPLFLEVASHLKCRTDERASQSRSVDNNSVAYDKDD